ncbi:MAG TPA: indole-3-glycerol phosphate synthase TrpC, partial [Victivallales bacterium]|nr:indole-3-glycerol phosphate synthase TrpC [Victivallales bacterium]
EPAKIAKLYMEQGADAISVLTEEDFFLGKPEYIQITKENAPNIPILRKDFIYNPIQIYESAILKADSFLLICAILEFKKLKSLIEVGRMLKMEALVETHSPDEIKMAVDAGAMIIGVNNRNLKTFQVDINLSLELADLIPSDKIKVSESGIKRADDCKKLRTAGYDAVLIGETLMRTNTLKIEDLKF